MGAGFHRDLIGGESYAHVVLGGARTVLLMVRCVVRTGIKSHGFVFDCHRVVRTDDLADASVYHGHMILLGTARSHLIGHLVLIAIHL